MRYFPYLHYISEDIDDVTFSNLICLVEREISQFFAWDYIINRTLVITRWLEDMTFILGSRVKNNILLTRCARS